MQNVAQSLSIEELKNQGFFPRDHRRMGDAFTPKEGQDALGMTIANRLHPNEEEYSYAECPPPGTLVQTSMLLKRELNNLYRDITALVARFGLTIFMSTLIGIIFFDVGSSDPSVPSNIQSRFGALVIVLMMSMFGTAQHALISFPQERPVFLREYSTNHYSVVSYFVSRLTIEACVTFLQVLVLVCGHSPFQGIIELFYVDLTVSSPFQLIISFWLVNFQGDFAIYLATTYSLGMASTALGVFLGCCFGDPELVQEMLPLLFIPQMLFAGFFVTPGLIPAWLRWAQYLCTMTFAIRILLVAEFEDCSTWYPGCEKVLNDVEADPDEIWWNWLILVVLFCVFRVAALAVLRMKAMQFF